MTPWEDDDWAWYVVAHHRALTSEEIAEVMGISDTRVQQIELVALGKLRDGLEAILAAHPDRKPEQTPELIRGMFTLYDRHRHAEREERENQEIEKAVRGAREEAAKAIQAGST